MNASSSVRRRDRRIPVCLVTGFLGSGKTTLLQRMVRRLADHQVVYLVNDFSSVSVDAERIESVGGDVISIPGGSIFCRCLVTDFIGHLRQICGETADGGPAARGVVIEASGMADPRVMEAMLRETRLDLRFRLARIVTLVDPERFLKLLRTLPNVGSQVECADLVLMNRCDLYGEAILQTAESALRALHPEVAIRRTVRADVRFDPFPETRGHTGREGPLAPCRDPAYRSITLPVKAIDVEIPRLTRILEELGDTVYRAKGAVPSGGCLHDVDLAGGKAEIASRARPGHPSAFTLIVRGDANPDIESLCRILGAEIPGQAP